MCTPTLRCPITPLTIESAELSSLLYFLSCFWLLSWSPGQVERRPNSKVPYVCSLSLSLSVQNQPLSNAGSSCFSLPCPDPWPSLNPDPWRATWQTTQASRLSRQTQTRFSWEIIADPGAPLQKCTEQVWISVISSSSQVSFFSDDKMRERALLQIKERIKTER